MEFAIAIFTLGAVLVLIGLVGGDLSYRGLTVPKVGALPRFTTTITGSAFLAIALAVWILAEFGHYSASEHAGDPAITAQTPDRSVGVSTKVVETTISDTLTQDAIAEEIAVEVDGESMGTLSCTTGSRTDVLTFTLEAGWHQVELHGRVWWTDALWDDVAGAGQLRAVSGAAYVVTVSEDGILGLAVAGSS